MSAITADPRYSAVANREIATQLMTINKNSNPLPDNDTLNTLMVLQKVKKSGDDYGTADNLTKLHDHIRDISNREATYLKNAFELLRTRPALAMMLGGNGTQEAGILANMLKHEMEREWFLAQINKQKSLMVADLGPLNMGPAVNISGYANPQPYGDNSAASAPGPGYNSSTPGIMARVFGLADGGVTATGLRGAFGV